MTSTLAVIPIETPTLGDRSYLVHDGEVAFVVDPQRDIDQVLALLDDHGVRLTHVFETHPASPIPICQRTEHHHVPSSPMQDLCQDHLERLRPARQPGDGRRTS